MTQKTEIWTITPVKTSDLLWMTEKSILPTVPAKIPFAEREVDVRGSCCTPSRCREQMKELEIESIPEQTDQLIIFILILSGGETEYLGTAATTGLL
jgi:hypothetical protein